MNKPITIEFKTTGVLVAISIIFVLGVLTGHFWWPA